MEIPTSNIALESALRTLLLPGLPSRPFICDQTPFDCPIAIVGINPATATPFWDYWSIDQGFDRAGWIAKYIANQASRRNQTRIRIERLVRALHPIRVIELNAYPYSTPSERVLTPEMRDIRVFELMLRVAKPKVIFVFGKSPARELSKILQVPLLTKEGPTLCTFANQSFTVIAESHLSRGWSYDRVELLAQSIGRHVVHAGP